VTLREFNDENARYYILTVLRGGHQLEVLREIWFDRSDLASLSHAEFRTQGRSAFRMSASLIGNLPISAAGTAQSGAATPSSARLCLRARFESTDHTMTTNSIYKSRKSR